MQIKQKIFTLALSACSLLIAGSSSAAFGQVSPSQCQSKRVKLQMLGTRGPELLAGDTQASTGYLIWLDIKPV